MFGKSELMFDFMSDAKSIHNAKNLVGELNQSMWTDYLTGLAVGLSLKKQILIVSIALDEYTIQKDNLQLGVVVESVPAENVSPTIMPSDPGGILDDMVTFFDGLLETLREFFS